MSDSNAVKLKGTIKSIKRQEGYGFITHTETGIDHFFHRSSVQPPAQFDTLKLDQAVEFVQADGPKGPRAAEVFRT